MKTLRITLAIILLAFSYQTVNARIIHVPADSSTIQKGINGANNGDTVLVARGTYYENSDFLQKDILVASNYIFDVLQATVDSTIIYGVSIPLAPVVKMSYVDGANSGIIGFTITHGYAQNGGGIFCEFSSAKIHRNIITENTATYTGGGICLTYSSVSVDSNQILRNEAYNGGGIRCGDSLDHIYGNVIRNNQALNGGGLFIYGSSSPTVDNNMIDSNIVDWYGGGIDCGGVVSPNIIRNHIVGNIANSYGGGICCGPSSFPVVEGNYIAENQSNCGGGILTEGSHAIIRRNIIAENLATDRGGGLLSFTDTSLIVNNAFNNNSASGYQAGGSIHCFQFAAPEIRNNLIVNSLVGCGIGCSNSSPNVSYNDVWNNSGGNYLGCPAGVGLSDTVNCNHDSCDSFFNITEDPLFDPDSTNHFLLCNSPCIDAGDPSSMIPPGGGRYIDMGFSEVHYIVGDANGNGVIEVGDIVALICIIYRNCPPPCPYGTGDVNCDCIIDVGDVVYLLNYLYYGGPPPCGSNEYTLSPATSVLRKLTTLGEIQLVKSEPSEDGMIGISVISECNIDISAVQLSFSYDPKRVSVFEPTLTSLSEGLQIYYSNQKGQLKIGILDINGTHHIPAGKGPIINFRAEGKDLNSLTISEAILVDLDAHAFQASTAEKLENSTTLPEQYCLYQNYPNPFNPETEISYDLPKDSWVKLSIYNIRGQRVKTLVDKFEATGHKTVTWDGTNDCGTEVASGIYFYKMEAKDYSVTKKMVLMR